jgi:hypothetical protein
MANHRLCALLLSGFVAGCGGGGKPAASSDKVTADDAEAQTRDACEQLLDCELIDEGEQAFGDCVDRGMYTIDGATKACARAYVAFEACVAGADCDDLEALFRSSDKVECRAEGKAVQQECNINVF